MTKTVLNFPQKLQEVKIMKCGCGNTTFHISDVDKRLLCPNCKQFISNFIVKSVAVSWRQIFNIIKSKIKG